MITAVEPFRFTLPAGFVRVPDRASPGFDAWVADLAAPSEKWVSGTTIAGDVERFLAAMASEPQDSRTWFVFVPQAPQHQGIAAMGWIKGYPASDSDLGRLRSSAAEAAERKDPRSLRTVIEQRSLGDREVLTAHMLQGAGESTSAGLLVERCSAVMVDPALALVVRLEVTAFDLRVFDDVVGSVYGMLASVARTGADA